MSSKLFTVVAPLAALLLFLIVLLEAFALMLATGAVWHETGWLSPISYAGALTVTWLLYVVRFIFGHRDIQAKSEKA